MNCRQCGEAVQPGQRFCEGCGTAIDKACAGCSAAARADARFCGMCGRGFAEAEVRAAVAAVDGERRQITVLFADLVGSTALSSRLDPEVLRSMLRAYQQVCSDAVTRYGGNIRQFLGDGVLAYFGHPTAHENDAERAVLAGLALIADLGRLAGGATALQARVGVHTGVVVVGAMGVGDGHINLAVGQAPNVAARVQGEAAPDTVCISAATHALVGGRFAVRALGLRLLKGVSEPTEVFVVVGATDAVSAPQRAPAGAATALVGRDAELDRLLECWNLAQRGHGQAVYLSGEGGIGKSRLLVALRERATSPDLGWRGFACSPFAQNSALQPVIDALAEATRLEAAGVHDQRLPALQRLLSRASVGDGVSTALVGGLLGLVDSQDLALGDLEPAQRKRRTHDALIAWLLADAEQRPQVLVVEDLHWVDASTRELLGSLLGRIAELPVLLLLSFRPEFVPPWPLNGQISTVALRRLAHDQVIEVARGVTAGKALPPRVIEEIVRRTDGVPLFVEEITKTIMASGLVVEREGVLQLAGGQDALLELPATLRDSLTARLDRLGNAKAVAQLASVLGREFDHGLLQAVCEFPEAELETQLAALVHANIIQQFGVAPRSRYVFKHALIQEAAYDGLLRSARQAHHQRIAQAYVAHFPDLIHSRPELPAHHFSRAAMPETAVLYWQRAGELAVAREGHEEAIAHLEAALVQIALMPDGPARAAQELTLRVTVGPALFSRRGMASDETGANYARACELALSQGETSESFMAMFGDWMYKNTKGLLVEARKRSEDLVVVGRKLNDDGFVLQGHHSRWTNLFMLGDAGLARADTREGIRLYDRERHRQHKHLYGGHDPGVCARCVGAVAAWVTGYAGEAVELAESAISLARDLDHSFSLAVAYVWAPIVMLNVRNRAAAQAAAEHLIAVCDKHGIAQWMGAGQVIAGLCRVEQGATDEGLKLVDQGLTAYLARGPVGFRPMVACIAASAHRMAENHNYAGSLLAQVLEPAAKAQVGWYMPEVQRQLAQSLLQSGQISAEEAVARIVGAAELARRQGALTLQWRAVTAVATLLVQEGRDAEAVLRLRKVSDEADVGLDVLEIDDARALLASLA